jgi:hypothetical protein
MQIFTVCENDSTSAYTDKARLALQLDKADLIKDGYHVDETTHPHEPATQGKGKKPVVEEVEEEEDEVEEDESDDAVEQDMSTRSREREDIPSTSFNPDEDEAEDEEPPLVRRRTSLLSSQAGPSNFVDLVDEVDKDNPPSSAPAALERVSSPPWKKAKRQSTLASPAQSRSPPGGANPSVDELVTRIHLQEQEHLAAQEAALKRADEALARQAEALRAQAEEQERQREAAAKKEQSELLECMARQQQEMVLRLQSIFEDRIAALTGATIAPVTIAASRDAPVDHIGSDIVSEDHIFSPVPRVDPLAVATNLDTRDPSPPDHNVA